MERTLCALTGLILYSAYANLNTSLDYNGACIVTLYSDVPGSSSVHIRFSKVANCFLLGINLYLILLMLHGLFDAVPPKLFDSHPQLKGPFINKVCNAM